MKNGTPRGGIYMRLVQRIVQLSIVACCLSACGPSEQEQAAAAEKRRIKCLNQICAGDKEPQRDPATEEILKLNGRWFIGPKAYFSSGRNGAAFYWPSKTPAMPGEIDFLERARVVTGHGDEVTIEIFLRSTNIPPEPHGYTLIELAEENHWIAARATLRSGLDEVQMKHVIGPRGHYIDHVTYYVATELRGVDGKPPVTTCSHDVPESGGGTGFLWKPGIWVGTRMNQRHCADWPEIYQETMRILSLLREIQ